LEKRAKEERKEKEEWMALTTTLRRGLTNRIESLIKEKEKLEQEKENEEKKRAEEKAQELKRKAEEEKKKEEEDAKKKADAPECCVCLTDSQVDHACIPCGHICLCHDCSLVFKGTACPKCRAAVSKVQRLFV
jgi:hypothetical protein